MAVPRKGEIFFVVAPTEAESGEAVTFDVGARNRLDVSTQLGAVAFFTVDSFPLQYGTGLKWFDAFETRYLPVSFPMPEQDISVTIELQRYDPFTGSIVADATRGPFAVSLTADPVIVVPGPPSGPFTSPAWLVQLLGFLIGQSNGQAVVDYGVGTLNSLFHPLVAIRNAFADAAVVITEDVTKLNDFMAQKDAWLAQSGRDWSNFTLQEAHDLDDTQNANWYDGLASALSPIRLITDALAPGVDAIADFVGAPWEWLKDHTPLGAIEQVVQITWGTLMALPDNWTNILWFPMDWLLNAIDLWLYEEVDPNE